MMMMLPSSLLRMTDDALPMSGVLPDQCFHVWIPHGYTCSSRKGTARCFCLLPLPMLKVSGL